MNRFTDNFGVESSCHVNGMRNAFPGWSRSVTVEVV